MKELDLKPVQVRKRFDLILTSGIHGGLCDLFEPIRFVRRRDYSNDGSGSGSSFTRSDEA
ncbi:MAG: hypothetical protein RL885_09945 [Planctomycetota bacterium]